MDDSWFFGESIARDFFGKNFGKMERKKLKSWGSVNELNDILDTNFFNDGFFTRNRLSEEPDDFFTRARRLRNRILKERIDSDFEINKRRVRKDSSRSSVPESVSSFRIQEITNDLNKSRIDSRKSSMDEASFSSRKSSMGNVNVTFPTSSSSNVSEASFSGKSMDRSVSRNSDDSICTEKSANCVSEKLADGTNKTQMENNECWVSKSSSGSRISEKKINDSLISEKNDQKTTEKSTKRMSFAEKSESGSSLQELMENVSFCEKNGNKTEQKSSTETIRKKFKAPQTKGFYEELEAKLFNRDDDDEEKTPVFRRKFRGKSVAEKISKLIDEAVEQDNLFKISSTLQTDLDKITDDFMDVKIESNLRGRRRNIFGAGKTDQDLTWSRFNELKAENEHLQQENSKLQSIIQDVTAVNKRWQKYNNERRLYVQKLLSTIQDLQEQINLISEKSAFQKNNQQDETNTRYEDIERLKKEHQEHITVLELQIKSHKDDWDAERKEKRKAVQEKEELEDKVKGLTRDINFLKNVLQEERNRKPTTCSMCKNKIEESSIFSKSEFLPPAASLRVSKTFLPKTFRTSVHVPYSSTELSSDECFFPEDDLLKERGESSQENSSYYSSQFSQIDETLSSEHFSRNSKFTQGNKKTISGDTFVVEDETGIRLSITEQYPQQKDSQLKSILKKNDKKLKLSSKSFSGQSDLKTERNPAFRKSIPMDEPNITCEEFESQKDECGLSIGFRNDGLARVTSFSPDSTTASEGSFQYFPCENVKVDNRSKSEPNTRNNSSENLQQVKESSSWECSGVEGENVVCPSCDRVFPPSTHLQFLDHFEICPNENVHDRF